VALSLRDWKALFRRQGEKHEKNRSACICNLHWVRSPDHGAPTCRRQGNGMSKKYFSPFLTLITVLAVSCAIAQDKRNLTGNEWLSLCGQYYGDADCDLVLVAASKYIERELAELPGLICIPSGVTYGQIVQMTKLFMQQNPNRLHLPLDSLVLGAFLRDFACKQ
jgi:hypothetical protein